MFHFHILSILLKMLYSKYSSFFHETLPTTDYLPQKNFILRSNAIFENILNCMSLLIILFDLLFWDDFFVVDYGGGDNIVVMAALSWCCCFWCIWWCCWIWRYYGCLLRLLRWLRTLVMSPMGNLFLVNVLTNTVVLVVVQAEPISSCCYHY